jgi:Tol biopolymer transport system component
MQTTSRLPIVVLLLLGGASALVANPPVQFDSPQPPPPFLTASVQESGRISATAWGTGITWPYALSADGRYLAYVSPGAAPAGTECAGLPNVLVLDLWSGSNELVSVNESGTGPGNGASIRPVMSADGRRVAFTSLASDLVAGDFHKTEGVFVRDLDTKTTIRVRSAEWQEHDRAWATAISSDGKWVAIEHQGGALSQPQSMLFEVDSQALTHVAVRASDGLPTTGASIAPRFSADGRYVIFGSRASDLVSSPLTLGWRGYAFEIATGELHLLSADNPSPNEIGWFVQHPVTTDGSSRWVVFPRLDELALRDLETGEVTLVAPNAANPRMSANGRWVAYEWDSAVGAHRQIVLKDLETGHSQLVSAAYGSAEPGEGHSHTPWISSDGRFVVFVSRAGNLVPDPDNDVSDVYLWDRIEERTLRLSGGMAGRMGGGLSYAPVVAADGRTLVFAAFTDNLAEEDPSRLVDLFLVTMPWVESGFRITKITHLASGVIRLLWVAEPGRTYFIEFSDAVEPALWQRLEAQVHVVDGVATVEDSAAGGAKQRYYRIRGD